MTFEGNRLSYVLLCRVLGRHVTRHRCELGYEFIGCGRCGKYLGRWS